MNYIIDEQLPRRLALWLASKPLCSSCHALDLDAKGDEDIIAAAAERSAIVVTKDADFVARGARHRVQIVWLRYGNCSNDTLLDRFGHQYDIVAAMLAEGEPLIELY
jgi:predicted nuclease of predicted toxin-antitoxin system